MQKSSAEIWGMILMGKSKTLEHALYKKSDLGSAPSFRFT